MDVVAILLAAGSSTRFGTHKLLQAYKGHTVLEEMLQKVLKVSFKEKILVTQAHVLEKMTNVESIQIVLNDQPEKGVSHSIRLALQKAPKADGYMFIVADQPLLSVATLRGILAAYEKLPHQMICTTYEGRWGNPVLFPSKYKDELLALEGDVGGKQVMKHHLDQVSYYEVMQPKELLDIDTKEAWEELIKEEE